MTRRLLVALILLGAIGCKEKKAITPNLAAANKVSMRSVRLFFESSDMLLVPEQRQVAVPENTAGAISVVVRELIKGSTNAGIPRLFPADTVVRGAYLLPDATVLVDLGGPTLSAGWSTGTHQELMAIHSLAQTLSVNYTEARRVRLLINGEPAETLGGHISLANSLSPSPSAVDPRFR